LIPLDSELAEPLEVKKKPAVAEKVAQMLGKPTCIAKRILLTMAKLCRWLRGLSLIFEGK
jgi:hypothetical protein